LIQESTKRNLGVISLEALIQAAQKKVLDSYRREFDFLSSSFRELENKAQGVATIAGAFLGARLALFNRSGGLIHPWAKAVLVLAVFGLLGTILLSVQALRVRQVLSCPSGDAVAGILAAIREKANDEVSQRLVYFYGDAANLWKSCTHDRRAANAKKANLVWLAQLSLTGSALLVAVLTITLIIVAK
jgi:hypothetical protein